MKTHELDPRAFLLGGGRLTLAEWMELEQPERDAMAEAGRSILQELAGMLLESIVGPEVETMEAERLVEMAERAARDLG